ncbi:MAG TPA: rod shape-determining protein MreC [Bacteroidales bacterium]|jgi:rod shape-determining protein MreC|nr:rod shape-determining protein MreC [Bacteroidales bacterium]HOS71213.1 rod shape-determining protein MreC [Bacteroidales bacterium]HQH24294.1 rod shape-determining protein MreC [Bacteroidales bacterium]HQJ81530.1 rod shape-determining protein MreC [Bacteroidales bacterium]
MRNLLNFFKRYNNVIIFLILEGIALSLLASGNSYHNTRLIKGIRGITAGIEKSFSRTASYFRLRETEMNLARENAMLRNLLEQAGKMRDNSFSTVTDSVYRQKYLWFSAEVINNSVNRRKNFLTLDKGYNDDLAPDMAVIADDAVAGVIVGCSSNYSVAMSLLNTDFRLSARIRSNGYFGSLSWDGKSYRHAVLNDIPQHVTVVAGDTVETTGYSAIFPEGLMIGVIDEIERSGSDFYRISVALKADFKKLRFVNLAGNLQKTEQQNLETQFQ